MKLKSNSLPLLLSLLCMSGVALMYVISFSKSSPLSFISPRSQTASLEGSGSGLVGWWKMNEGSGTTAADSSGSGNTGTLSGSTLPSWVAGKIGNGALSFDGSTSHVSVPGSSYTDMTISAWINPSNITQDNSIVGGTGVAGFFLIYSGAGVLAIYDGSDYLTSLTTLNPGQWYLATVTFNGSTKTYNLYLNGTLDRSWTGVGTYTDGQVTDIGRNAYWNFKGSIDDVRVYSRALTSGEVLQIYDGTSDTVVPPSDTTPPSIPTNLVATTVSSSQINLTWTASTDNIGGSGMTGYKIYRNASQVATSPTNSFFDTSGLTANTTYTYTVSAYDAANVPNVSAQSTSAVATTQSATVTAGTAYVAAEGDSITAGYGANPQSTENYVAQLATLLPNTTFENIGLSGDQIANNTSALDTINHLSSHSTYSKKTAVFLMGTNDIAVNDSVADITHNIDLWIAAVRAANPSVKIIGMTLTAGNYGNTFQSTFESRRLAVDAYIRSTANFDYVVDLAADPRFSDYTNMSYYQPDQVHPNNTGYGVIAALVGASLFANGRTGDTVFTPPSGSHTYYVSKNGNDNNPGTQASPWLRIQKAADTMVAGDTVIVSTGDYHENVRTKAAGISGSPITFLASGTVNVQSFYIANSWQVIQGFTFNGIGDLGNALVQSNGGVGDVGTAQNVVVRSNIFNTDIIAMDHIDVFGTNWVIENNQFLNTWRASISASGSGNIIRNNYFSSQTGADLLYVLGDNLTFSGNTVKNWSGRKYSAGDQLKPGIIYFFVSTDANADFSNVGAGMSPYVTGETYYNGHDGFKATGTIPNNWGGAVLEASNHPDIVQASIAYGYPSAKNLLFENNNISDSDAQFGNVDDANSGTIANWTFRNNIFVRVSNTMNLYAPGFRFYNNTFYRDGIVSDWVVGLNSSSYGQANNTVFKNNLFVECGYLDRIYGGFYAYNPNTDPVTGFDADYNLVVGVSPYMVKGTGITGFNEAHGINGLDPKFVNPAAGDFHLQADSPAIGAGTPIAGFSTDIAGNLRPSSGPWDIGAYQYCTGSSCTTPPVVTPPSNLPPTVSLQASPTSVTAPTSIILTATASDSDGTVSKVEFYNGSTLLATDSAYPYTYTWGGVAAGTYTLTAKAYDNLNALTVSNTVTVIITSPSLTTPTYTPTGGGGSSGGSTPPTLTIGGITTSPLGATTTAITWITSLPGSSQIIYGLTTAYGSQTTLLTTTTTTHQSILTNLQPNTVYHFKVVSNGVQSGDLTFTTGKITTYQNQTSLVSVPGCPTGMICTPKAGTTSTLTPPGSPVNSWLTLNSSDSQVTRLKWLLTNGGYAKTLSSTATLDIPTLSALQSFQCKTLYVCSGTPTLTGYGATEPRTRAALATLTTKLQGTQTISNQQSITQSRLLSTFRFTTVLKTNTTSPNVKNLQIFLNDKGYTVSTTGPGSRGNESTYFGPATMKALANFQRANNITPAVGNFGTITLSKVNQVLGMNGMR